MVDSGPALSLARHAPALAFSVYDNGRYQVHILRGESALAGTSIRADAGIADGAPDGAPGDAAHAANGSTVSSVASSNGSSDASSASRRANGVSGDAADAANPSIVSSVASSDGSSDVPEDASSASRRASEAPGATLPPGDRVDAQIASMLQDDRTGLPDVDAPDALNARPYEPALTLDRVGQPYVASGGGPLGGFLRAGGALGFGDLLGERRLSTVVQVGSRARDLALGVYFLNRERRWNWGAVAELEPSLRRVPHRQLVDIDGQAALAQETHYFQRIQLRVAGLVAYPLSHARRLEFTAGVRHARYDREVRSRALSLATARVLRESRESWDEPSATMAEVSAAFVGDTAVHGPTSPILGSRYRVEVAPAVGGLASTRLLLDYRRYLMPVRPFTLAARLVHIGQYGPDANDPRLVPTFLGSRYFVRGYGWSSIRCEWDANGACAALGTLLGSRLGVANLELRAPLMGLLSRDITYRPVPAEVFLFADNGAVWSSANTANASAAARGDLRRVSSAGAGVRLNALGIPLEVAAVRAFDAPARGWSFDLSFRTGF
jgi:hypothetical protein